MLARILLILCAIIWGWTFVATRVCLEFVTPFELLGLRLMIALPVLFIMVKVRGVSLVFEPKELLRILIAGGIITAHFLIQITGLKYTSAVNTGWLIAVSPLAMATLAFLILKEKISRAAVLGIFVATLGIVTLVSEGSFADLDWLNSIGDWLVLLSAHTWALYTVVIRDLTRKHNPLAVTVAVLAPSAVIIPLIMLFSSDWTKFVTMSSEAYLWLLFLGVFGAGLAHWFWQKGVATVGAANAGIYLYLEPLATTALAVPYLNEYFGWPTALGGALVLGGVYVAEFRRKKSPTEGGQITA